MTETRIQLKTHSIDEHETTTDMEEKEPDAKKRKWSRQWSVWSIVSRDSVGSIDSGESFTNLQVKGAPNSFMKELTLHPYFPYWPIPVFFIMVIFLMIVFSISGFLFY